MVLLIITFIEGNQIKMQVLFKPFKAFPKKVDTDTGQYEYIKMQKSARMNLKMCEIFDKLNQ